MTDNAFPVDDATAMLAALRRWFYKNNLQPPCELVFETKGDLGKFINCLRASPAIMSILGSGDIESLSRDRAELIGIRFTSREKKPCL